MPLPLIKLGVLVLKQLSKPIANTIKYRAKEHPLFRTNVVVPLGQLINRLTTRGNMWRLGFSKPTSFTPLSEQAAVELGSETVSEVVIWGIALGTFFGIESWSTGKATKKDNALKERLCQIESRLELLEATHAGALNRLQVGRPAAITQGAPSTPPTPPPTPTSKVPPQQPVVLNKSPSSLPVDDAVKIVAGPSQKETPKS